MFYSAKAIYVTERMEAAW